jgi:hypothetical protein
LGRRNAIRDTVGCSGSGRNRAGSLACEGSWPVLNEVPEAGETPNSVAETRLLRTFAAKGISRRYASTRAGSSIFTCAVSIAELKLTYMAARYLPLYSGAEPPAMNVAAVGGRPSGAPNSISEIDTAGEFAAFTPSHSSSERKPNGGSALAAFPPATRRVGRSRARRQSRDGRDGLGPGPCTVSASSGSGEHPGRASLPLLHVWHRYGRTPPSSLGRAAPATPRTAPWVGS